MIIDLSKVLKYEDAKVEFDSCLDIKEVSFAGDTYRFLEPIRVTGSIHKSGGPLQLTGRVSGVMSVNCYRCMKEVQKDFNFQLDEILVSNDSHDTEDDEAIRFNGDKIDITEVVINNILINMSMKHLCSVDCKGLCPQCGADLNVTECKCSTEVIDPRLEVLKKLLNNKE
ncbi:MAG: DUF177 domain-containing protein [Clostridiaceae bacterium]|nr:DUF177 domain-containing protein [Clostridiaceae bacterium]